MSKENLKQHRAYCIYVAQHLTLQEMADKKEQYDLPGYHTLKSWSRKYDWKNRRKEFYDMEEEAQRLYSHFEILQKGINSIYYLADSAAAK